RYPDLRITALECGHGWLPAWAARLDELAEMTRHALPPLSRKPSEYVTGGRYFQGMHIPEGERCFRHTVEALGADTLMFATDYPHSESWFPKSVDIVMAWPMAEDVKRKLLWDNAARCFARYGSKAPR